MQVCIPKIRDYSGQPVRYAQEKKDGYLTYLSRYKNRISAQLKNGGDISHLNCFNVSIPDDTVIVGELYWDGPATSVVTLIKENSPKLKFSAFALPVFRGLNYEDEPLATALFHLENMGLQIPWTEEYSELSVLDEEVFKAEAVIRGYEGFVFKESHFSGWYKCKPQKTVDAFVVDYDISESNTFMGNLKAFKVAVLNEKGEEVIIASVGTGFKAEFKKSCDPKKYIGKVLEVKYQSVASQGNLQFPRFVRWRDDKLAGECFIDQLN